VLGVIRYRVLLVAGLILLPVAASAFPGSARKVEQRFGDRTSRSAASSENSWEWRTREWRHILPYGERKPFFGQGFGRYERLTVKEFGLMNRDFPLYVNPRGQVEGFSAHNDYVKTFVESGLVGLALWVLWLIGLLVAAVRASRAPPARELGGALVAIVVAAIVMSASDNLEGYPFILLMVAALVGGAAGLTARYERERLSARSTPG
jgi:putative inorganic carbon (hco3(-)) transporter